LTRGKIKLLKEALRSLRNIVTLDFPAGDETLDYSIPRFGKGAKYSYIPRRGPPTYDEEKCCGCGACASVCSASTIRYVDEGDKRKFTIDIGRCIFCQRCQDTCPEEAIHLGENFIMNYTGPAKSESALVHHEVDLIVCKNCGHTSAPIKQFEIYTEKVLENIGDEFKEEVKNDLEKVKELCIDCRRKKAYALNIHTRKFY